MATMKVTEWVAGSCAAVAIQDLGSRANAEDAMITFFKKSIFVAPSTYSKKVKYGIPEAHIIFIAGPEEGTSYHTKPWAKYGTEFALYIRDNKLGVCVTAGKVYNKKHHSSTQCQVWVWQPDRDALIKWWEGLISEKKIDAKTGKLIVDGKPVGINPTTPCGWCKLAYEKHVKKGVSLACPNDMGVWEGETP